MIKSYKSVSNATFHIPKSARLWYFYHSQEYKVFVIDLSHVDETHHDWLHVCFVFYYFFEILKCVLNFEESELCLGRPRKYPHLPQATCLSYPVQCRNIMRPVHARVDGQQRRVGEIDFHPGRPTLHGELSHSLPTRHTYVRLDRMGGLFSVGVARWWSTAGQWAVRAANHLLNSSKIPFSVLPMINFSSQLRHPVQEAWWVIVVPEQNLISFLLEERALMHICL
jgi:hypothetical protein